MKYEMVKILGLELNVNHLSNGTGVSLWHFTYAQNKNINVFKKQMICGLIGEYIDQPFTIATGGKTKSNHQIKFLKITYNQFNILRSL
jgi:hypothetical protein